MGQNELQIPELDLLDELGRGAHSVVFRARRNGRDYAVKVPLEPVTDPAEVRQRLREAATLALIRHPSLPAVVDVGVVNGVPYVAMELARGVPLTLELGSPMSRVRAVILAKSLASVLHEMHTQSLVHRDIKPANILIDDNGSATLVDFGLAIYTTTEQRSQAAGTFLYAAPEQTGMLKRSVDGRADLYALGAVLYECMTGQPPFVTEDVAELLRQHAAVLPRPVRELTPNASPGLSAIIERLLAKDPDDRYQSGAALSADLDRLEELDQRYERASSVLLRTGELPAAALPLELVGRDQELSALGGAWDTATTGRGQTMLVEGPPGSGKSRLLLDFSQRVPVSLACRCVAGDPMPYAALRQLTDSLLAHLIDPERSGGLVTRERVQQAAGDAGALLRVIAPRLASAIGDFSATHQLDEAEGRVERAMADLLLSLATLVGPLLITVDDVQWIDQGSRKVLEQAARGLRERPLLLVLAGRNDPDSGPALASAVSAFMHTTARVELGPLNEDATSALIRNYLGSRRVDSNVTRLVLKLSDGLPLLVREITRALVDDGRLRPHWGDWQLDLEGADLLDLPLGAQRLVERRLEWIGSNARNVLRVAAVGGLRFDEALLARVGEVDRSEVTVAIAEGQRGHLVERDDDGRYKFVHTRIADVLLTGVTPATRAGLHRRYARALDERGGDSDELVFALAHHYACAGLEEDGRRVFETNLEAGIRALRSHAGAEAYELLQHASDAATKCNLPPSAELWESLGEACHHTRRLQEAFDNYDIALRYARDPLVWSRIQARRVDLLLASHALTEASATVSMALAALDAGIPRGDALSAVTSAVAWTRVNLRAEPPVDRRGFERMRLLAKLYAALGRIAYQHGDLALMIQAGLRLSEPAHALGDTPEGAQALADHAMMLSMVGVRQVSQRQGAHALTIANRTGDPIAIAHARWSECYAHLFSGEVAEFVQKTRARLEEFRRWLPTTDVLAAHYALMYVLAARGHVRQARAVSDEAMLFLDRVGARAAILGRHPMYRVRCAILCMLGEDQAARELLERCEAAEREHGSDAGSVRANFGPMALLLLESRRFDALGELEKTYRERAGVPPQWQLAERSGYACVAQAKLTEAIRTARSGRKPDLTELRIILERADPGRRLQQHRAMVFALQGAVAFLEGNEALATKRLDDADRLAREGDNPLALFEVGRFRAHMDWSRERFGSARTELVRADAIASAYGLTSRMKQLRAELPLDEWRSRTSGVSVSKLEGSLSRDPSNLLLRRHLEALLTVALATADQIDSSQQARAVLDHLVRILGAERGFFFLSPRNSDGLELAAGRGANGEDVDLQVGYSRSVVERVRATRRPYVHSSGLDGLRSASDSVVAGDLRSIIAAPLLLDDQFVGVIYLDNHLASGVFCEDDLSILSALSAHIAIAIETNRATDERRQLEARLRQQQKLESIGTLASGVAHEVNNPIQGIMSYAELIRRYAEKPETVREFSGHIIDECRRVATIIKNLLALARTDEDKRTPENLFQIVQGSLSLFRVVLQKDQITLDLDVPDNLPDMRCNGQQIQQVIMNLVTNARDALNERPRSGGDDKRIRVNARLVDRDGRSMIRMTVEDDGTGIEAHLLERIFDPFFTTKPQGQGTGLGLWICHRIISEQGGNLSVESEPGVYTRFHVDLPAETSA